MNNTQLPAELEAEIREMGNDLYIAMQADGGTSTLSYARGYQHGYELGATAYAVKLYQAQQEIERLKQWKEEAKQLLNPIWDYAEDNLKVALGESKVSAILERSKRAQYLLKQVIASDAKLGVISTGITNEIKTFLDGK